MIYLTNYKQFESTGVPNAIVKYVDFISKEFESLALSLLEDSKSLNIGDIYEFNSIYDKSMLSSLIDDRLPIGEISVKFTINIDSVIYNTYSSGSIDYINSNNISDDGLIKASMDLEIYINKRISNEGLNNLIRPLVFHEFTHLYEHYNRYKGNYKPMNSLYVRNNTYGIKKEIWNFWIDNILNNIYNSNKSEMNAIISEVNGYSYMTFDEFKLTDTWLISDKLLRFNLNSFIDSIKKLILKYYKIDEFDYIMNRLKMSTYYEYNKLSKYYKSSINSSDGNLNVESIPNMSVQDFLTSMESMFNKSGEYLRRKMIKLFYNKKV